MGGLSNGDSPEDALFRRNREKSAALSHINQPQRVDLEIEERKAMSSLSRMVRGDEASERRWLDSRRIDTLDRNNVIKDAPEKYLLQAADQPRSLPPGIILPVPRSNIAEVYDNCRITPGDHWQDVRLITLFVHEGDGEKQPLVDPTPGSTITLYPKNYPEDVQTLIDRMGWQAVADKPLEWAHDHEMRDPGKLATNRKSQPKHLYAPKNSTLRDLLIHNIDFTAIPKRSFIQEIVFHAKDARERERLLELVKPGNSQEFYDYTSRPRRTILELLQDFPSVMIPWDRSLSLFPMIRGREFSVANGGNTMAADTTFDGWLLDIVVALVEYKTLIRKPRTGLCSRYLKYLPVGSELSVMVRSTSKGGGPPYHEEDAFRPLIAVATGTGIAPIRALIHERELHHREQRAANRVSLPETLLFFGCRGRDDFHFGQEWADVISPIDVITAFSRDPFDQSLRGSVHGPQLSGSAALSGESAARSALANYDSGKNYVQHYIRANAKRICKLLQLDPIIAICGQSGRMPVSVREAFWDAFVLGGLAESLTDAQAIWQRLNVWQETW
jgi:sulfite reductase alpha subunit-like flavoprotein